MRKELGLLNLICLLVALGFVAMAVISALGSGDFLTIDNLFIITVSMVMALMFAINPLFYLKEQGKLPLPFLKRSSSPQLISPGNTPAQMRATTPPLLDAKGRAVPPDVKAIMARLSQTEAKDV